MTTVKQEPAITATPCVLTTKSLSPKGYGQVCVKRYGKRVVGDHRRALIDHLGRPLGPGMQALHGCDNPACISTESGHLYEGTHAQNMRDKAERGRATNLVAVRAAAEARRARTHCKRGHEFTPENTHIYKDHRKCRACARPGLRAYQARLRAARKVAA